MPLPRPRSTTTPAVEPVEQDPLTLVDETADLSLIVGHGMVVDPPPDTRFHPVEDLVSIGRIEVFP